MTDIQGILEIAVAEFDGNQAALALELGVTRATVSRWMSGHCIPDEGSCLRLAKLTGHLASEVFRLAGRDPYQLPTEPELMADAELAGRLRQWGRRIGGLSTKERAIALSVLDDLVKTLCLRLGQGELRREADETPHVRRRSPRRVPPSVAARRRPSSPFASADPKQAGRQVVSTSSDHTRTP